jgi:peroxiredoxin
MVKCVEMAWYGDAGISPQVIRFELGLGAMQEHCDPADLAQALQIACKLDGTLNERLSTFATALRRIDPPFAEAVDRLVERLVNARVGSSAPNVGDEMPDFMLPDSKGRLTTLEDILVDGPAAIVFHRGHWCPYCQIVDDALVGFEQQARAVGGGIIAITPDRQPFVSKFKVTLTDSFPVLIDIDNGYALSLGLAIWGGDELGGLMRTFGLDLGAYQGNESWFLPIPASFVVDRSRTIVARHVNPDYRQRMELQDLLAALRGAAGQSV